MPSAAVVDGQALQAALRLVLAAREADDVAARLPRDGDLDDLRPVARDAVGRARMERLLARLPLRGATDDERLLGAASGVPAEAAVALALGVGLRLDGRDLADALDVRVERVGEWLVAGRRALDREMPDPCRKTAALVGRYDDRSLDPDERVEVITHLNRCPTCQQIVERSRAVDGVIVGELGRLRAGVAGRPAVRVTRLERMRRGAMAAGLAMLLILALVAGGAAVSRLTQGPHEPAPLVGREAHAPYSGWLVLARSDGSVLARHLSTGESRRIIDSDDPVSGVSGQVTLSPGGTRLMTFYSEYSRSPLSRVIVNALDGAEIGRLEWSFEDRHYYPTGWIDERRVLVSVFPVVQQGLMAESNAEWYEDESRLLIVDVETGQERELLRGNVAFGIPSPDGRHVAVARMMDRNTVVPSANALAIEIWPVEANAGSEPIVTVDGWVTIGKGLIWAGDGSRLFATLAVEAEDEQPATNTERRTTPNYEPHAIFAIELDGETRRLAEAGGDSAIYPASAAPDGSAVVYLRSEGANVLPAISYWRVGADGGEPEQLSGAVAASYGGYGVAWSPDEAAVLVSEVAVPYLEREDTEWSRWNAASTRIVAVASGGQRTTLLTSFSVGDRLLGWLPDEALPQPDDADNTLVFTAPEPVAGVPDRTRLAENSAASSDGLYVTLDDVSVGSPLVWETKGDDTQRLRGSLEDAGWLPGARGLMSVSGGREESRAASRLSVLASTNPYAPLAFEPRQFDPAEVGDDRARRYAAPRVSPDGLTTAFFVVNTVSGVVELWVASAAGRSERVAGWTLPGNRIIEPALTAGWAADGTLIFVEPRDWRRGMPETAAVRRVTVAGDGSVTVDDVIELAGRGDDVGIAVTELAISANGYEIAWRMRHYTEWAADDGRYDTIHLAPADDVTRDVELTRGSAGSGLAWSADSRLLLAGVDGEAVIVDAGDLRVEVISGDETAQHPLWVGEDEIWFSAESGDEATVMRVRVRGE